MQRRRPAEWGRRLAVRQVDDAFSLTAPVTITIDNVPVQTSTAPAVTPTVTPSPSSPDDDPPSEPVLSTGTTIPNPLASAVPTTSPQISSDSNSAIQSNKLPGGIIAAIVIISVVAFFGLLAFFARYRYIQYRKRKTLTWGKGMMSKPVSSDDVFSTVPFDRDTRQIVPSYYMGNGEGSPRTTTYLRSSMPIAPPPMSYNNPGPSTITGLPSPGLASPTATATANRPPQMFTSSSSNTAVVQCTFIPTLPDELSISTGETVRVLGEYDDGWALCANSRGEQGMVPLECLDRVESSGGGGGGGGGGLRNSKRASSLLNGVASRY
jgi:Variant SH3 domain